MLWLINLIFFPISYRDLFPRKALGKSNHYIFIQKSYSHFCYIHTTWDFTLKKINKMEIYCASIIICLYI